MGTDARRRRCRASGRAAVAALSVALVGAAAGCGDGADEGRVERTLPAELGRLAGPTPAATCLARCDGTGRAWSSAAEHDLADFAARVAAAAGDDAGYAGVVVLRDPAGLEVLWSGEPPAWLGALVHDVDAAGYVVYRSDAAVASP